MCVLKILKIILKILHFNAYSGALSTILGGEKNT